MIWESLVRIFSSLLITSKPRIGLGKSTSCGICVGIGKKVQEIKEEFTKSVHSITGTLNGNDDELTFPAFQSRKRKKVDKRFKGLSV